MNEQDLEKILNSQKEEIFNGESQEKFQKKVKKVMNRSLYGRVIFTLLLIGVFMIGLFFGVSKTVDMLFYSPEKETSFLNADHGADTWKNEEFTILFEDTISTYFPGKFCWMLEPVQSHGFGQYSAPLLITDAYGPQAMGPENGQLHISLSKLDIGHAPLAIMVAEFVNPQYSYTSTMEELGIPRPEDIRQELQDLPKSAYLDVSLSFPKSIGSEEVAKIINDFSGVSVRWLALEGQNTTIYEHGAGGMFVNHYRGQKMTEEAAARYPNYVLPEKVTGKSLEQCLQSRLQMLIDHPDFVSLMETRFPGMISMSRLKERMVSAQDNWACYGMRLVGGPEEIEELMDALSVTYARINNVKISKYQK